MKQNNHKWSKDRKVRTDHKVTKLTYADVPISLSLSTWLKSKGLLARFKRNVIMLRDKDIETIESIYEAFRFDMTHEKEEYWNMWAEMYEPIYNMNNAKRD